MRFPNLPSRTGLAALFSPGLGSLTTLFAQPKVPSFHQGAGSSSLGHPPLPWVTPPPPQPKAKRHNIVDPGSKPRPAKGRHAFCPVPALN